MTVLNDEIKKRLASDPLRQGEGVGLVNPHQWSVDDDAFVEAK
jgi:hypothetical protein